jgi:hypothetical protein
VFQICLIPMMQAMVCALGMLAVAPGFVSKEAILHKLIYVPTKDLPLKTTLVPSVLTLL